jgi:hypothetical protein
MACPSCVCSRDSTTANHNTEGLSSLTMTAVNHNTEGLSSLTITTANHNTEGLSSLTITAVNHTTEGLPHLKVILPTAPTQPVTMNMGHPMPAWYDLVGM